MTNCWPPRRDCASSRMSPSDSTTSISTPARAAKWPPATRPACSTRPPPILPGRCCSRWRARRLLEGDALARSGQWKGWNLDQLCGADVWGKTLGILGFGRIGRAVARRARGFGMRVIYNDAVRAPTEVEQDLGAEYVKRDEVLAQADFLSLHVPLLPDTRGMIGAGELAGDEAHRVSDQHLARTGGAGIRAGRRARKRQIAGAALDVYEREPQIGDGLRRPNVVLAPHLASASPKRARKWP